MEQVREALFNFFEKKPSAKIQTELTQYKDILITVTDNQKVIQIGVLVNNDGTYDTPVIMNRFMFDLREADRLVESIYMSLQGNPTK
jgi:hypothetical protein